MGYPQRGGDERHEWGEIDAVNLVLTCTLTVKGILLEWLIITNID